MCEGQMEELEDLEKGTESIDKPMLVLLRYSALQLILSYAEIYIIEDGGEDRED